MKLNSYQDQNILDANNPLFQLQLENEINVRQPINEQEWEQYYDIRYRILRQPLGQEKGSEKQVEDQFNNNYALFGKIDNQLKMIAVGRLDKIGNETAQVRFLAVDDVYQKKGYGLKMMQALEKLSVLQGMKHMLIQARDYAIDFYKKQNYNLIGPSYKLFDVLQHYRMEKILV